MFNQFISVIKEQFLETNIYSDSRYNSADDLK